MNAIRFLLVIGLFSLSVSNASAVKDKKAEEPYWPWQLGDTRAVIPEVEPNNSCSISQQISCGDVVNPARIDVAGDQDWYSFSVPAGIPLTIGTDASDLCDPDAGDTYLELYQTDCATRLAFDDDSGPGLYSLISNYPTPYSGVYFIKVRHFNATGTGCYKLFLTCTPPASGACCLPGGVCQVLTQAQCTTQGGQYQGDNVSCSPNPCPQPPPNDTCAGAASLNRCSGGVFSGDLTFAVNDYDPGVGTPPPSCTGFAAVGKDVTYRLDLQAGDLVHLVYTTPNHDGSIYIVTDCLNVNDSCVIGVDDPEPETIDWTAPATGLYYLIVDAYGTNGGGAFTLEWSITCPSSYGACCFGDQTCAILSSGDCSNAGGLYLGNGTLCNPNPCPGPCVVCGPGPHWVETCPGGPDAMPSGAVVGIDTNLDCVRDMNVVMFGPVNVQRSAPSDDSNNYPGTRPLDGHFDVIDTEILSMSLTGSGFTLVGGFGQGDIALAHSFGVIAEQPGDPNLADSFFDVFFEVSNGGNQFYNQTPLRISSNGIVCLPPGSIYEHFQGCIPLYTSPTPGQGVHVANLVTANHEPFPGRGACCIGTQCSVQVSSDCLGQDGTYQGDNTVCDPDPCLQQPGACCFGDGTCQVMTSGQCAGAGGLYMGDGVPCNPNPCPGPCVVCGPGPHWVETCPGGPDAMPSGAVVGIDTNLDCLRDVNIVMFGPVHVQRSAPSDDSNHYPGTRPIDGHLDVIDTEITSMSLTGSGFVLVGGFGQGDIALAHSFGVIAEQMGNPNLADSFFDVFFEVSNGGNHYYNQSPLRISSNGIICVPPGSIYEHFHGCIPLYTSPTPGQGVHVANLVTANHEPFPGRGACCIGTQCTIMVSSDCLGQDGNYQGDDSVCSPNPCLVQTGACCFGDGTCQVMTSGQCANAGGLYLGNGTVCNPNPCPGPCAVCGPGPHWVDQCQGGLDAMPSGAVVGIDTNLDCVRDVNVVMFGPVQVQRSGPHDDSVNYPGTRPLDGHLDVIDTEIIAMSLTGSGFTLVGGVGHGDIPLGHSFGVIAEQPGDPNLADSFFDVFFEVTNGTNHLYNQMPLRISSTGIICVPPGSIYEHFQGCIPLYTSPTPGQGVHVANLVTANHEPFPGRGACCIGTQCVVLVSSECLGQNGIYQGDDSVCSPTTCTSSATPEEPLTGSPRLFENAPNPVVDQTTIRFYIPTKSAATLEIYDARGAVVRSLTMEVGSGTRSIVWDRKDQNGRKVSAGIYQYVVRAGSTMLTGKMTVIQ